MRVKPLFIEPGSHWENGHIESLNWKMRKELLARESFYSLKEAQGKIEMWRWEYNAIRPHYGLAIDHLTGGILVPAYPIQQVEQP